MSRADQLRLYAEHEQAALRIARGYRRKVPSHVELCDLESAARIGLWDAVSRGAERGREGNFDWYVQVRVRGSIQDWLRCQDWLNRRERQRDHHPKIVYFEQMEEGIDRNSAIAIHAGIEEQIDERRQRELFEEVMRDIQPRDGEIMRLVLEGVPQYEIAERLGISFPRVSQLLLRGRLQVTEMIRKRRTLPRPRR